ncbi:helix-turn-helix domain-containing protein [archaeon]|nr:helix-turn-helix domain-containing protein [archaeon]
MEKGNNELYNKLCSYENLEKAFNKARKRKTFRSYVIEFEDNLEKNLLQLRYELLFDIYKPRPLQIFILRDPKTRKISKSDFRDRVIHHALCNVIEKIFEKKFIYDSHANRINKGTLAAIKRFDYFKNKVSRNNTRNCFVLKADIKHYFDTVNQNILIEIIKKKIKDKKVLDLIKLILTNHKTKIKNKGMPLGNLTSQFFANVYLNELDQFIKHKLKVKYYIRYVDDFVILDSSAKKLEEYKEKINEFLTEKLDIKLHEDKSRILKLSKGINFLGLRIFPRHKLITRKNLEKFERNFKKLKLLYKEGIISHEKITEIFEGWLAYISNADTYKYRNYLMNNFDKWFPLKESIKITSVKKHKKFIDNIEKSRIQFSSQKTLFLYKKVLSFKQIARKRNIKESTVWEHFAKLIEYHQISIWKVIPKNKIKIILPKIISYNDTLKDIKERINNDSITFNEINCVLASVKCKSKEKDIFYLTKWFQKINCRKKCYFDKNQRQKCRIKFDYFASKNPHLMMKNKEFVEFVNNNMNICFSCKR